MPCRQEQYSHRRTRPEASGQQSGDGGCKSDQVDVSGPFKSAGSTKRQLTWSSVSVMVPLDTLA